MNQGHARDRPFIGSAANFYGIPITCTFCPSRIFMAFRIFCFVGDTFEAGRHRREACQLFAPTHDLSRLEARLRGAQEITPELMSDVMQVCERLDAVSRTPRARVIRLIESGAWTDAALALLQLELPRWKVRRLVQEGAEWLCTLSRHPQLPLDLDEPIEDTHEILPLAILIAMLDARHAAVISPAESGIVPRVSQSTGYALNCDNFA